jgi:hypothetical protein
MAWVRWSIFIFDNSPLNFKTSKASMVSIGAKIKPGFRSCLKIRREAPAVNSPERKLGDWSLDIWVGAHWDRRRLAGLPAD